MNILVLLITLASSLHFSCALRNGTVPVYHSKNQNSTVHLYKSRQGKFWPFYNVVRFQNNPCTNTTTGETGTCYLRSECRSRQGAISGTCARGLGICCIIRRNCGGLSSTSNNTYFRSPRFPERYLGGAVCTLSIAKSRPSVTHVRLTFTELELGPPNDQGVCATAGDRFSVIGTDSNPPAICGVNNGQHMYLKFLPDNSAIQIVIAAPTTVDFRRRWNILVTQHEQNQSPPPGCLQYFTEGTGQIRSFNYNTGDQGASRHLANLNYAACIRTAAGYCSTEWRQVPDGGQFFMSGPAAPVSSARGDTCVNDYVIIPNAAVQPTGSFDRFCGNNFEVARTSIMPPMLGVITNGNEQTPDVANTGFNLQYQQILC